jgi:hypothetical protein
MNWLTERGKCWAAGVLLVLLLICWKLLCLISYKLWYLTCWKLLYFYWTRVYFRVWNTRRVRITRRVRVRNEFLTRLLSRVTRWNRFWPGGCGYGWPVPIGYVPVAIPSPVRLARYTHSPPPLQMSCTTCLYVLVCGTNLTLFRLEMKIFWMSHRMCWKDVGRGF